MVHTVGTWLLVAGFLGAGVFNAIGTATTQSDFSRWGYPRWWNRLTGGAEILCAGLLALPVTHLFGLALGAIIIAAALATVLRHRDFSHLVPLSVFAVVIAVAASGL